MFRRLETKYRISTNGDIHTLTHPCIQIFTHLLSSVHPPSFAPLHPYILISLHPHILSFFYPRGKMETAFSFRLFIMRGRAGRRPHSDGGKRSPPPLAPLRPPPPPFRPPSRESLNKNWNFCRFNITHIWSKKGGIRNESEIPEGKRAERSHRPVTQPSHNRHTTVARPSPRRNGHRDKTVTETKRSPKTVTGGTTRPRRWSA